MSQGHSLRLLRGSFAIARLAPEAAVPGWVAGEVTCVARTPNELSILCGVEHVPSSVRSSAPWRCLEVAGPLEFSEVGILSSLASALADAAVSVFVVSTFDTDYLLVRQPQLAEALGALEAAGHRLRRSNST